MNSNGLSRVLTLADDGLSTKQPATSAQQSLLSKSSWKKCHIDAKRQRDRVRNQPKQGASPVVHPQQQISRTSNASSLLQWGSHRTSERSQIPRDPLRQNAYVQDAGRINKTQVQERTARVKSHGFKRHENNVICSTMLSKKNRGVDWQEASHGWVKQLQDAAVRGLRDTLP